MVPTRDIVRTRDTVPTRDKVRTRDRIMSLVGALSLVGAFEYVLPSLVRTHVPSSTFVPSSNLKTENDKYCGTTFLMTERLQLDFFQSFF